VPARSAEARERLDTYRRDLYYDRKSRQVCVYCESPLEDSDGTVCAACVANRAPYADLYRLASKHGRKVRREAQRAFIKRRVDAGLCVICASPREAWPPPTPEQAIKRAALARKGKHPQKCPACAEEYGAMRQKHRDMKEAGILDLERERRRRAKEERIAKARAAVRAIKTYRPADEIVESTKYRLLVALERVDWITPDDLYRRIGLGEFDADNRTDRDRYAQSLGRYVKTGLVRYRDFHSSGAAYGGRVRGSRNGGEYQITATGRAELADMRAELRGGSSC
jgi:hypothetical protein